MKRDDFEKFNLLYDIDDLRISCLQSLTSNVIMTANREPTSLYSTKIVCVDIDSLKFRSEFEWIKDLLKEVSQCEFLEVRMETSGLDADTLLECKIDDGIINKPQRLINLPFFREILDELKDEKNSMLWICPDFSFIKFHGAGDYEDGMFLKYYPTTRDIKDLSKILTMMIFFLFCEIDLLDYEKDMDDAFMDYYDYKINNFNNLPKERFNYYKKLVKDMFKKIEASE